LRCGRLLGVVGRCRQTPGEMFSPSSERKKSKVIKADISDAQDSTGLTIFFEGVILDHSDGWTSVQELGSQASTVLQT